MHRLAVAGLLWLSLGAIASAQNDSILTSKTNPPRVTAAAVAPVTVTAGKESRVEMQFTVGRGYHVNSNKPKSELLIPTKVSLNPPTDILISSITYPEGKDLSFPFAPDEKLNVYTGNITVSALVRADKTTPPGRYRVHGQLKYQACDDRACYPPAQVPVAFDVKVLKAAASATGTTKRNPPQSPHVHQ